MSLGGHSYSIVITIVFQTGHKALNAKCMHGQLIATMREPLLRTYTLTKDGALH